MRYEEGAKYKIVDSQKFEEEVFGITTVSGDPLEGFVFTVSGVDLFAGVMVASSEDFIFNGRLSNPAIDTEEEDGLLAQGVIVKVEEEVSVN